MSDCTYKINLNSLLPQETDSSRPSLPHLPSIVVKKTRRENDAWCIVATDGSTSIIGCKAASNLSATNKLNHSIAQDSHTTLNDHSEDVPDFHEVGVDLSDLNVEEETISKLIAGMHAMTSVEPGNLSRRAIAMPNAVADLHELLKTDNVCMVSKPKAANN